MCCSEGSIIADNNLEEETTANGPSGNGNVRLGQQETLERGDSLDSAGGGYPLEEGQQPKADSDDGKVSYKSNWTLFTLPTILSDCIVYNISLGYSGSTEYELDLATVPFYIPLFSPTLSFEK